MESDFSDDDFVGSEVDEENPNKKTRVYCTEAPKKVIIKQVIKKEPPKKI